jgi:hypothetical protein
MQDEGINVSTKLGDDELHALSHKPRDEMNVPAEAVELGNDDGTFTAPCFSQSCGELRPAMESVGAPAGLSAIMRASFCH